MQSNYNMVLKGLYPELSAREHNIMSQLITRKLRKHQDEIRKVELYNQEFIIRGPDQKFSKVEVFNRTIHLRITLK